eukprot:CAMPEP_0169447626 /NCGR_PEP_ID=MMETSP1042-20121227/11617_1 /TAXON_ID=464988 /ORGANISM="Hemiselmis andersenii, Strain CCMP1180" /LENGTH=219 /DNA_ID=CAMNT_0009559189 /DNA_START=89 /DNA_END=747 /DNA_ORIENTATION=+
MCCTAPTLESTPVLPAGSRPAIDPQKLGALRGPLTPRVRAASLRGIEGLVACPLERAVAQEADKHVSQSTLPASALQSCPPALLLSSILKNLELCVGLPHPSYEQRPLTVPLPTSCWAEGGTAGGEGGNTTEIGLGEEEGGEEGGGDGGAGCASCPSSKSGCIMCASFPARGEGKGGEGVAPRGLTRSSRPRHLVISPDPSPPTPPFPTGSLPPSAASG